MSVHYLLQRAVLGNASLFKKSRISVLPSTYILRSCLQIFLANQKLYTVEQNDAEELVARAARNIEQLLRKRSAALEVKPPIPSPFSVYFRDRYGYRGGLLYTHGVWGHIAVTWSGQGVSQNNVNVVDPTAPEPTTIPLRGFSATL